MKPNDKAAAVVCAEAKAPFETPVIEIITFSVDNIITTSGGFGGDDDPILPPDIF